MAYTYPAPAPSVSGDIVSIHRLLKSPTTVARRLRTLLQQRYIADALLTGRYRAEGGSILYETGESLFSGTAPERIAPLAEYPIVVLSNGTVSMAKVEKWGQDALVSDEAIKRLRMDPVNRGLSKLVNQNVKTVDSTAMAVVASAVTATAAAAADWSAATAKQIFTDVMLAKANIIALNEGFDPDIVVIDDINWAYAMAAFADAGYLPRERNSDNPVLTGDFPVIGGMRWMATPNVPVANRALVADSTQLGGMADEDLESPGYVSAEGPGTAPVEVKVIRDEDNDSYKVRARRVTVPVVVEPGAGRWITGI